MEKHFKLSPLDPNKLIKYNDLKEVTDPVAFDNSNSPSPNGLLSNQIFGIVKEERAGTFAYIDLHEDFIHPLHYKIWCKTESKVKQVVHGANTFKVNSQGELEPDPNGDSGVKFLKKNIDKLTFGHGKRVNNIQFLRKNKDTMFINKFIIIPAYYRDVNTDQAKLGIGEINKLYQSLLIAVRALKESSDYGLSLSDATRGRVQEILVQIYDWFGSGTTISGVETGGNLPGKFGVIKRANMSKTADYSTRLVISAPQLKVENMDDLMVDTEHAALPLASACVNFYPYILFYIRRFFEEEFSGKSTYSVIPRGSDKIVELPLKDWQIFYSDTNIKKEIDRFIHGYSNRFIPIEVPVDHKDKFYMVLKGRHVSKQDYLDKNYDNSMPIQERYMTWCDLLYIAACEVSKNKTVLITRYPIDSYYNQFPTKVVISSTKETEPMVIESTNTFYKFYPKIRQEDILSNTANKFVDTLVMNNTMVEPMGGDYDGDQVTVKPIYGNAANKELQNFMQSKAQYISLGGQNVRKVTKEGVQSLYNLTMCPDDSIKFTDPTF